jgi:hypothetical protein
MSCASRADPAAVASPAISRVSGRELAYCTTRFVPFRLVYLGVDYVAGNRPSRPAWHLSVRVCHSRKSWPNRETGFNRCHFSLFTSEYCAVTKLYVGNLPFTATEEGVRALFSAHGTVEKVSLITDRDTGRPRGFGFVEMSNADASRAMQALNGKDFEGRALRVNEAQDRERSGGGQRSGPRRY